MPVVTQAKPRETKPRPFFRSAPSSAFDQYLHDIQKLPLISDASPGSRKRETPRRPNAS
jgi:RNA polymerase primary sigma factor